jgi:hypothetical protein
MPGSTSAPTLQMMATDPWPPVIERPSRMRGASPRQPQAGTTAGDAPDWRGWSATLDEATDGASDDPLALGTQRGERERGGEKEGGERKSER